MKTGIDGVGGEDSVTERVNGRYPELIEISEQSPRAQLQSRFRKGDIPLVDSNRNFTRLELKEPLGCSFGHFSRRFIGERDPDDSFENPFGNGVRIRGWAAGVGVRACMFFPTGTENPEEDPRDQRRGFPRSRSCFNHQGNGEFGTGTKPCRIVLSA